MTKGAQLRPRKEAARITVMLDTVLGADRFDRAPVDMINLALEYSRKTAPSEAIERIDEAPIPGCVGALVCGDDKPRKWGILYDEGQSPGRRAFTVGHEFGHWVLHRDRVDEQEGLADGFYCNDEAITQRDGLGIEEEADIFAADLLMPFHDFRNQLPPRDRPDFDRLNRPGIAGGPNS